MLRLTQVHVHLFVPAIAVAMPHVPTLQCHQASKITQRPPHDQGWAGPGTAGLPLGVAWV